MKVSCNGCRVLRKGCNESCTIRPCLEWIPNPDSQSNATLFLAKFYGRSGLLNLIEAGPSNLRPATFRSLLYEACGRMVSPMYGSLGLLWSGNWGLCQAAVEAVLKGEQIIQIPTTPAVCSDASASVLASPLQTCDIRHASKDPNTAHLSRMKSRTQFKRTTAPPPPAAAAAVVVAASNTKPNFLQGGSSSRMNKPGGEGWRFEPWRIISRPQPLRRTADSSRNSGSSVFSFETLESFLMNRGSDDDRRICLDLTLGLPMRN